MKEIDKTRENIRISDLDDIQKKDLFEKFVDGGGKVISERNQRRSLAIDRDKQYEYRNRLDDHYRALKSKEVTSTPKKKSSAGAGSSANVTSGLLLAGFRIRMRLRFLRITPLSTIYFHKKFLKSFSEDYKPALITMQMIYYHFFKKNPSHGRRITGRLDKISTIYYEVIEKTGELYDQMTMDQITMHYQSFPDVPKPVSDLREPLMTFFRGLTIIKPYENIILNAFEKTLEIDSNLSEGGDQRYKRKDIKNALYIIFYKLYPRLHTLFCHYQGDIYFYPDSRIDDIFAIAEAEKPGNRMKQIYKRNTPSGDSVSDKREILKDETVESETSEADKYLREGFTAMSRLDFPYLRRYDKKHIFELVDDSDKILICYLIFLEFEYEYSFVMTTNKIKFNVDFTDNIKVDFKQKMQDLFNEMRKCHEAFQAYADSYAAYSKIKVQRPMGSDQYYAYSKRLDDAIKRKDQVGNMARMVLRSYMDRLGSELEMLINDMDMKQRFIENPQDILDFSLDIEGDKKLHNKKIFEAIKIIYSFVTALAYRLGPEGDLSGKIDNYEIKKIDDLYSDTESGKTIKGEGGSILDELDDII